MDGTTAAWIFVIVAGLLEPTWIYFLERSEGFKIAKWTVCMIVSLSLSLFFMSLAMRTLGAGTTYAVWTGIGVIGSMVVGAVFFKEKITWVRMMFLLFVVVGIVGINITGGAA